MEIILDYCGSGNVITSIIIGLRRSQKRETQIEGNVRKTKLDIAGLEDGSRP